VIHIAMRKTVLYDAPPEMCIADRAFVSTRKFGSPAYRRTRSRSVESPRPCHSFKKNQP
jgi:hypothetical protein